MEDWKYHKTYSGTPHGGIISPLLANIFLHQLDTFIEGEFKANQKQSKHQSNARRNPEARKIENKITRLRRKLRETDKEGYKLITDELEELERQRKCISHLAKDKRIECKVKYVRYADDFVILVAGTKEEADAIRNKVKDKLSAIGLKLSDEKTKTTHWSQTIQFLGYNIQGKLKRQGVGIRAVLNIPPEKVQKVEDAIKKVSSYHHIPEADIIAQINSVYRGWCNYYRYANSPQKVFNKLASKLWWNYAHYLARKHKTSIAKLISREIRAKRLAEVKKNNRVRKTYLTTIGTKTLILNVFPPKTGQIRTIPNNQDWDVDLMPINVLNWQSGRSLTTRLAALDRANGVCERCKEKPVFHVHHTVPIKRKSFLARVMSDKSQKETAIALCKECHLTAHGGSF